MLILKFIRANSLRSLQERFQRAQLGAPKIYNYHPPIKDGNEWIITWYEPMDKSVILEELSNGGQSTR